jgi:2,4-dienoyl-CoA reductase-like NADH-dependent reductase (Old Yellow Enzyme family)
LAPADQSESRSTTYPTLFDGFTLAGRHLRNRIVHAAISPHFGAETGIKPGQFNYYENRARGGAAMVITEPVGIAAFQGPSRVCAWNDSRLGELQRWADSVERHDCRMLVQIQDSGRGRHIPGRNPTAIGASALPDDLSWTMPRALSRAEIHQFIQSAADASFRLMRCGFSGVEISAGHGHLFHQFMSPRSNRRNDEYGGDLEGRCRLLVETARAIRAVCGDGFIIGIKLPGDDGIADSVPPEMAEQIVAHVSERFRADFLSFAHGTHHRTLEMHIPDDSYPRVPYLAQMRRLRARARGVPVMALGRITDPAEAEALLVAGDAELIGLGRALITDPRWPDKARRGLAREIRYCVSCNTCWKVIITHKPIVCDNNPRVSRADELDERPPPAAQPRRVVVVGAGPAGLEAAWTAAARGHQVWVWGASPEVGGKARLQASLPLAESISSVYDWQYPAALRYGVQFRLGKAAELDDIIALQPEQVILASGSRMSWPVCLPDSARELVPDLRAVIAGLTHVSSAQQGCAVVFDMDQTEGTYAAIERLRDLYSRVVVLTSREHIAEDTALSTRQRVYRRFHARGIEIVTLVEPVWSETVEREAALEYTSVFGGPPSRIGDLALFCYATPRVPEDGLLAALQARGIPVIAIGDARNARDMLAATSEGHAAAMAIGN